MSPADLDSWRADHEAVFGLSACPDWVKDSLKRYETAGIPTGDFLRAVLANDLQGAIGRADINTARCIAAIVGYVYNKLPGNIHGSYEIVDTYVEASLEARRAAVQS